MICYLSCQEQFKYLVSILLYCTCLLLSGLWTCILAAIASATQGRHLLSEKYWVHLEATQKAKGRCLGNSCTNTHFSRRDQLSDHKLQRSGRVFFPYFDELADEIAHCLNKFGKNNGGLIYCSYKFLSFYFLPHVI